MFDQSDDSGIIVRTFEDDGFQGNTNLHDKPFALVDSNGHALACVAGHRIVREKYNKASTSRFQLFRLNENEQLVSVGCVGKMVTAMTMDGLDEFQCKNGIGLGLTDSDNINDILRQK